MRRKARAALLSVTLSALVLGACSDDADEPERAELRPVAQSRAPDTPVIDREAAVPREVREKSRKRSRRRRAGDGVQKAAAPSGGARRAAPSAPTPVATPAPAPSPPRQPAATPSQPPAGGGGGQARAKPVEGECAPRCP